MSDDLFGMVVQGCNTGLLVLVVGELRTLLRRQRRIMARLGVVEKHAGITPPPNDTSGPHPIVRE